jgi:hypothetical protein
VDDPEIGSKIQRAGLMLAAAKAALQKWQGHMRRAALLQSEDEYAAALALVHQLPQPAASLARTLRGLADLYASQKRLDDAASLMQRIAENGGRLSAKFWGDYTALLFQLGLKRIGEGSVAAANQALARAGALLEGPADLPEVWRTAFDGYGETALWFERAAEPVPAGLYAEKALAFAGRLQAWNEAAHWLRRLSQAGRSRGGVTRALHWLERLQALRSQGWPDALGVAVQAALSLAQGEWAADRRASAKDVFARAEAWMRAAGGDSPALADLHLGWGLVLGGDEGRGHLELALSLRRRTLGPQHPRTLEAEQALSGLAVGAGPSSDGGAREWDGGLRFEAPQAGPSAQAELKRLQRRLVRLCHPDGGDQAPWRHDLMVRVNQAVDAGDLYSLRGLLREALARQAQGPADAFTPLDGP